MDRKKDKHSDKHTEENINVLSLLCNNLFIYIKNVFLIQDFVEHLVIKTTMKEKIFVNNFLLANYKINVIPVNLFKKFVTFGSMLKQIVIFMNRLLDLEFEEFIRVGSVKKIAKPVLPFRQETQFYLF